MISVEWIEEIVVRKYERRSGRASEPYARKVDEKVVREIVMENEYSDEQEVVDEEHEEMRKKRRLDELVLGKPRTRKGVVEFCDAVDILLEPKHRLQN